MEIFFSWSGARSKHLARAVASWLRLVVAHSRPWMSEADLDAGKRWGPELSAKLAASNFGVACVTPENSTAPWLLFEAGALAKSLETARLIPLLFEMRREDLAPPLSQFQALEVNRQDLLRLALTIADELPAETIRRADVTRLCDLTWPSLEEELGTIPKSVVKPERRDPDAQMAELLAIARRVDDKLVDARAVATAAPALSADALLNQELLNIERDLAGYDVALRYHNERAGPIPQALDEQHRELRYRRAALVDALRILRAGQPTSEGPHVQEP